MDAFNVNEIVNLRLDYYQETRESMNVIPRCGWKVIAVDKDHVSIRYDKDDRLFVMIVQKKYLSHGFI